MLAGVQQVLRQVAVGGKEQKARGVAVQAAHREQSRKAVAGDQVGHAGALLRVAHGGEVAGRLVEHQVYGALVDVDGHAASGHQVLRAAAARHARTRQKALQAHGVRIDGLGVGCGCCVAHGARLPYFVSPRHANPPRSRRRLGSPSPRLPQHPQHRYRAVRALRPGLRPAPRVWTERCGRLGARG